MEHKDEQYNEDVNFVSKYGSSVSAFVEEDRSVSVKIVIPSEEDIMTLVVSAYLPVFVFNITELDQVIKDTVLPFVFDLYITDPILRIKLYYEFGLVDVIEDEKVDEVGDYYIAVEKFYEDDVNKLVLIGCCPDGTSYFTPESALTAYKLLEAHSEDEVGLPLLEEDMIRPIKYYLFRKRYV